MKTLCKGSFGTGPRLPVLRCGKTNCWNCSKLKLVGIHCHFWLFVISTLEAIGILLASIDITTNGVITTACHRFCRDRKTRYQ